jgi:hypothetical protein
VLAVKPRRGHGAEEELRAVAAQGGRRGRRSGKNWRRWNINKGWLGGGVRSGVRWGLMISLGGETPRSPLRSSLLDGCSHRIEGAGEPRWRGNARVGAGVGHGQDTGARVLELEVLILELGAVDGLAARAVARREVAALDHKVLYHAVKCATLVPESLLARRCEPQCILPLPLSEGWAFIAGVFIYAINADWSVT